MIDFDNKCYPNIYIFLTIIKMFSDDDKDMYYLDDEIDKIIKDHKLDDTLLDICSNLSKMINIDDTIKYVDIQRFAYYVKYIMNIINNHKLTQDYIDSILKTSIKIILNFISKITMVSKYSEDTYLMLKMLLNLIGDINDNIIHNCSNDYCETILPIYNFYIIQLDDMKPIFMQSKLSLHALKTHLIMSRDDVLTKMKGW